MIAELILDFLTEIWMYEIALYSSIDHAKKSYNLTRTEVCVINDLMQIKRIFIQNSIEYMKQINLDIGLDTTIDRDATQQADIVATKSKEISKLLSLKLFSMFTRRQIQMDKKQVYRKFQEDISQFSDIFKNKIISHFVTKMKDFEKARSELMYHDTINKMRDKRQYSNIGLQLHN